MAVNRKKGSKRYGQRYTTDKYGSHVYTDKRTGKKTHVGGRRPPKDPYKAQVESNVRLKFGPADEEIASERRISDQMVANTGDWWGKYQQDVAAANQRTQAGYRQAQQGVYGQANQARSQDQAQAAELEKSAQANAALRGATAGPSPAAQAQAARQASMSSFGGLVGAQGAAQGAYGNAQYANAGGIRASELGKERQRRGKVEKTARELALDKGAFRVSERERLSDAAWKTKLEELTFGAKREDQLADNARQDRALSVQQRRDRQSARDRAAQRRLSQRGQDLSHEDRQASQQIQREKAAKGGSGSFTPTQKRAGLDKYQKARGLVRSDGQGHSAAHMVKVLTRKGWSPDLARAAVQRELYGGVDKKLAARVKKQFGFNVKIRRGRGKPLSKTEQNAIKGIGL